MYNTDKYFDFDLPQKVETKSKKRKKQKQQALLLLFLFGAAAYYYFMIYLPEEGRKILENQIQTDLEKVKNLKSDDYDNITTLLTTLQGYLLWSNGTEPQKLALENKKEDLASAIKWLEENKETPEKLEEKLFKAGRIWELPAHSWADREVKKISGVLANEYKEESDLFQGRQFNFSRSATYTIHFPPALKEYYEKGKSLGEINCQMIEEKKDLILSNEITTWEKIAVDNPIRGTPDPNTKRDNNALFYGAPGTGKTATTQNICFKANKYPLVEIKGSSLTPRIKVKMNVAEKFYYTLSELEWKLYKTYCLEREPNGEIRYILFVDECNQISNNAMAFDANKLQFIKDCLGCSDDRKNESHNLWIFATNHLDQIEEAAYRAGRLSNALDFSWTWNDFLRHAEKVGIIGQIPERWKESKSADPKVDQWVKKFSIPIFYKDFLGDDPKQPDKPKFWNLFITNNPNAIFEEEIEVEDENGNKKKETDETKVELDEFLEFFWYLRKSGQLSSYQGDFKSPKQPKTEEVLDTNLPEMSRLLVESSNSLSICLENITEQLKGIMQQMSSSSSNAVISGDLADIRNQINDLYEKIKYR